MLCLLGASVGFTSSVLEGENKTDLASVSCTLHLFLLSACPLGW